MQRIPLFYAQSQIYELSFLMSVNVNLIQNLMNIFNEHESYMMTRFSLILDTHIHRGYKISS